MEGWMESLLLQCSGLSNSHLKRSEIGLDIWRDLKNTPKS